MKKYIASSLAAFGLIIFLFGIQGSAQSTKGVSADIPFDFYVRGEKLPAGKYEIETLNRQTSSSPLIVRSLDSVNQRSIVVHTSPVATSLTRKRERVLKFRRYGSAYFLSSVDLDADESVRLPRTSRETEIARSTQEGSAVVALRPAGGK